MTMFLKEISEIFVCVFYIYLHRGSHVDCSKYKHKRIVLCIVCFIVALFLVGPISDIWVRVWSEAMENGNVILSFKLFIVGQGIIQLLIGIAVGIAVTPVIVFIIAPLFGIEIALEKKIRLSNVVIIDANPENSISSVFLYSYIVFGLVVVITRIIAIGGQDILESYFIALGFVIRTLIPFILLFLVSPYILRDKSSIRALKKNLTITYPSRIQQFVLTIVVGMGSIAALAPMYSELVTIVGDVSTALMLFIYIILMALVPSITVIIGFLIGIMKIAGPFFQKSIERLESIVKKYGKVKTISLIKSAS